MSLLIQGGTIYDGTGAEGVEGCAILIEAGAIAAIGKRDDFPQRPYSEVIDASGKYLIPGLMDTNVHLAAPLLLEDIVRYESQYELIIAEAAQAALKNGLTTVFDTWGPRRALMSVRDRINTAQIFGSRIFCAGNIIGLGGPFSENFFPEFEKLASPSLIERVNELYAEDVGAELTWMCPEQVGNVIRRYASTGIDFVKYASTDHKVPNGYSSYLTFSPEVQRVIVEAAHRAGLTAQAHSTSVEGLRIAAEAGCDIIQHANLTGPTCIPESTFALLRDRKTACTVLPFTTQRRAWILERGGPLLQRLYSHESMDVNVRNLITSGVPLLLCTDSMYFSAEALSNPSAEATVAGEENLYSLGTGHFHWFKAMQERGLSPMEGLKAATHNIAVAMHKDKDLGSLEAGRRADIVILNKDPMQSPDNYSSIYAVIKDGSRVDRSALPACPIMHR